MKKSVNQIIQDGKEADANAFKDIGAKISAETAEMFSNIMQRMELLENKNREFSKKVQNMEKHLVDFDEQFAQFVPKKDLAKTKGQLEAQIRNVETENATLNEEIWKNFDRNTKIFLYKHEHIEYCKKNEIEMNKKLQTIDNRFADYTPDSEFLKFNKEVKEKYVTKTDLETYQDILDDKFYSIQKWQTEA